MSEGGGIGRRDFLKVGGAAAAGLVAGAPEAKAAPVPPLPANARTDGAMPTRNLGSTGYRVGIFSLGGQAAVEQQDNEAVAVPIIERALDLGINYVDTAAAYGRGASQRYIGMVMAHRRRDAFLTSKTHDRTREGSLRLLDESLRLLQTDHVDLWQLHRVSTMRDVEQIFAPGGAIEALQRAREQGLCRFLGVTGHSNADVLMEMIRRFPFDTVLMAINAADRHHGSFAAELLPLAVEKRMGIIGMKIPARSRILPAVTMREAMYYVLSHPVSTVIVGVDSIAQLEENVRLAHEFTPLSDAELAAITAKTAPVARDALFFRSWA